MSIHPTTIRKATSADVPQILAFIHALAEYERESDAVQATEADLERDGFGKNPSFHALIAEQNGKAAGFALYFFNYSTWVGRPGLFVEDLFVLPGRRRLGIGKAMLARLAALAVERGCQRMQWKVLDWNKPAMEFYRSLGAEFQDEWRNVLLTDEAHKKLANFVQTEEPDV